MTPEHRQLVVESWKQLGPHHQETGAAVFRHLFTIDPKLRSLFAETLMEDQYGKFAAMVDMLIGWLDAPERLVPVAKQLGARHTNYGVRDEHYTLFGAALMAALAERLGSAFTPAVRSAWVEAYLLIVALMRRGALRVSGSFPTYHAPQAPDRSPV